MIESLRLLGVTIEGTLPDLTLEGVRGDFPKKTADLFVGNAGTVARFLTAALAFNGGEYRLDGVERMRERPIADLVNALRAMGAGIDYLGREGFPPIRVAQGALATDRVRVRGDVSSQFLTALLLLAPTLRRRGGFTIEIEGELISRPYVRMTVEMMRAFGVDVLETERGYFVPAADGYVSPGTYRIEPDASGASYFFALGALTGGPVRVNGLTRDSIQGDVRFLEGLQKMGADVFYGNDFIEVSGNPETPLKGIEIDCVDIPDAAMTYVPMALCLNGELLLTGIASWRVKETDRLAALACEMRKLGAEVETGESWIRVRASHPAGARVATYNDHRMAMALSLAACAGIAVEIENPDCVSKTFPTYFETLKSLA